MNISKEVWVEDLEKLADGTYKRKNHIAKARNGVTFDEHLADYATLEKAGHVKAETDADGKLVLDIPKSNYNATEPPTKNDDTTRGYSIGSNWIVPNETVYVCVDSSESNARWLSSASETGTVEYYYKDGSEYVDFILVEDVLKDGSSLTMEKKSDRIYFKGELTKGASYMREASGFLHTKNHVNFSRINSLFVDMDYTNEHEEPSGARSRFEILITNHPTATSSVAKLENYKSITRSILKLDTTNINGWYYISIYFRESNADTDRTSSSSANIYGIWGGVE